MNKYQDAMCRIAQVVAEIKVNVLNILREILPIFIEDEEIDIEYYEDDILYELDMMIDFEDYPFG